MRRSRYTSLSGQLWAALLMVVGLPGAAVSQGATRENVLIGFRTQPGPADEALVRGLGGKLKYSYRIVPAIAASLPQAALDALVRNPNVTYVEPDGEVRAIDAELTNTWGVARIGSEAAHVSGNLGAGVKVAVLDTGMDYLHPDLAPNYAGGWDFVNNDDDPQDDEGHGTHVAGTIAARDDGVGVVGVAPEARIYALKIMGASGTGSFSDVVAALEWCLLNSIQVTSNSYGSRQDPGITVQAAFDNSYAAGILHLAAAGNSGNSKGKGDNVEYPGRYDSVVAVAATDMADGRASFSSSGPTVELSGPGTTIKSTLRGGGYGTKSGTSMACPHVSGAAALFMAVNPSATNVEIRGFLDSFAQDLGSAGRDNLYGYGLVDVTPAQGTPPPADDPPIVTILAPKNGDVFVDGTTVPILLQGTATDPEDGDLSADLVWTSDLETGSLGSGASFSTTLTAVGTHTLTAQVTDSGGNNGSQSVTITVGAPPPALQVAVSPDQTVYANRETVRITVTVTDGSSPVSGAAVSVVITTPYGFTRGGNAVTDSNGVAVVQHRANSKRDGSGLYSVIADASAAGYEPGTGVTTFWVNP